MLFTFLFAFVHTFFYVIEKHLFIMLYASLKQFGNLFSAINDVSSGRFVQLHSYHETAGNAEWQTYLRVSGIIVSGFCAHKKGGLMRLYRVLLGGSWS